VTDRPARPSFFKNRIGMNDWKPKMEQAVRHFAEQLRGIRTGTISVGLIQTVRVSSRNLGTWLATGRPRSDRRRDRGNRTPGWRLEFLKPFDFLCCINRWPFRSRYELYPRKLRERLPLLNIPLADEDPDVTLDLQSALEQVYVEGRYGRRIRYDQPCEPPMSTEDQSWADEQIAAFRSA
jgi:hypothetical protein